VSPAKPHERGRKDTVLVLPGQVTRIRAKFDVAGRFVWHCHILEHEDNEMMRPFRIGPAAPGEPRP
jgi:FtsP/CotA-like multicopper oxidase with cupredoxin domain